MFCRNLPDFLPGCSGPEAGRVQSSEAAPPHWAQRLQGFQSTRLWGRHTGQTAQALGTAGLPGSLPQILSLETLKGMALTRTETLCSTLGNLEALRNLAQAGAPRASQVYSSRASLPCTLPQSRDPRASRLKVQKLWVKWKSWQLVSPLLLSDGQQWNLQESCQVHSEVARVWRSIYILKTPCVGVLETYSFSFGISSSWNIFRKPEFWSKFKAKPNFKLPKFPVNQKL